MKIDVSIFEFVLSTDRERPISTFRRVLVQFVFSVQIEIAALTDH